MKNNKSNTLMHYGVLGMKWGHKKQQSSKNIYKMAKRNRKYKEGYSKDRTEKIKYYSKNLSNELIKDENVKKYLSNIKDNSYDTVSKKQDRLYNDFRAKKSEQYKNYLKKTNQKHNSYAMDTYVNDPKLHKGDTKAEEIFKVNTKLKDISDKEWKERERVAKQVLGKYENRKTRSFFNLKGDPISDEVATNLMFLEKEYKSK